MENLTVGTVLYGFKCLKTYTVTELKNKYFLVDGSRLKFLISNLRHSNKERPHKDIQLYDSQESAFAYVNLLMQGIIAKLQNTTDLKVLKDVFYILKNQPQNEGEN